MYKNKIKEYRIKLGLTIRELADKSHVSVGYICHLEKGKRINPSTEVMEDIAKALNKTIAEIFFSE